jgi:large subunit ribosomal protein L15
MQIHQLQRKTEQAKGKYIGRGGKRGTTSGRGTKGQMARSGHKLYPELRDAIKKLPKLRGYRFKAFGVKAAPVNLRAIEQAFESGSTVDPAALAAKKLVKPISGKIPPIKILGSGALAKKLSFQGVAVSASAKEKIEKAGGEIK